MESGDPGQGSRRLTRPRPEGSDCSGQGRRRAQDVVPKGRKQVKSDASAERDDDITSRRTGSQSEGHRSQGQQWGEGLCPQENIRAALVQRPRGSGRCFPPTVPPQLHNCKSSRKLKSSQAFFLGLTRSKN